MGIGPRIGSRIGQDAASSSNPLASVTRDAASGKYLPSSSTEWSTFRSAQGLSVPTPDFLWLMQDPSGNPTAAIGGVPLTAGGTVSYQNSEPGWARKFLGTSDGVAGSLSSTNVALADPDTTSLTVLVLANVAATPAAQRSLVEIFNSGTASIRLRITTTPRLVVFSNPNSATGTSSPTGQVRPYWLRYERNANTTGGNDTEKLAPTHTNVTGNPFLAIGGSTSLPAAARYGYVAAWNSAVSDAALKACLQAMGFPISWS